MRKYILTVLAILLIAPMVYAGDGDPVREGKAVETSIVTPAITARDSGGLKLYEDGGKGIFIQDSTGYVGIGTASPATKLHVDGAITMGAADGTDNASPALTANITSDFLYNTKYLSNYGFGFHQPIGGVEGAYMSGYYGLDFFTSGTNRLTITSTGNVGIGTTGPLSALHIEDSGVTRLNLQTTDNYNTPPSVDINAILKYNSAGDSINMGRIVFAKDNAVDGNTGAYTAFYNKPAGVIIEEAMRIDPDGNVGINDTSPSYKLEVNGTSHVTGEFTAGTKTFVIDHPIDPLNKLLYHAVFEGPEHGLIYRGVATLKGGKATIDIDKVSGMTAGTFEALTQNAAVMSLQNQDSFDRLKPGAIAGAKFDIICENATSADKVAWVVMAARKDPLVKASSQNDENGNLIVEVEKQAPTQEELALLEKKIEETDEVGKAATTERIDILSKRKGYLMHPECRGETRPTRQVEYKLKAAEKEPIPK